MIGITEIFRTVQGEGALLGVPMVFIRTAGCSVGCKLCDTNYSMRRRITIEAIVAEVQSLQSDGWVWVTGGEPTDWVELPELTKSLKVAGYTLGLATSGIRNLDTSNIDFLSVSPHGGFVVRQGQQLNVVPGLNGMRLDQIGEVSFQHKYVTPCDGKPETLQQCIYFVTANPDWRLGIQAHKVWQLP